MHGSLSTGQWGKFQHHFHLEESSHASAHPKRIVESMLSSPVILFHSIHELRTLTLLAIHLTEINKRKTWRLTISARCHDQRRLRWQKHFKWSFVWHPRILYTLGHHTIIRFQIVKGMPFFIKEGQGNSEMGGGKEDQYLSLQIQMLSQRETFRKENIWMLRVWKLFP